MKPGVYENLSFPEYQAIKAVNCSTLVAASRTLDSCLVPKEQTDSMRLGIMAHSAILENKGPAIMPEGMIRKGKAWQAFKSLHEDREIASHSEMTALEGMKDSLNSGKYETARLLIAGCDKREVTLVWKHRKFGCLCKARLDGYSSRLSAIADLKTSTTADPERWMNTTLRAGGLPHWQVGHYLQGVRAVLNPECKTFLWVLIENKPPYGISVVQAAPAPEGENDMAYLAEIQMEPVIERYLQAKRTGKWPGREDRVVAGKLPAWFVKSVNI